MAKWRTTHTLTPIIARVTTHAQRRHRPGTAGNRVGNLHLRYSDNLHVSSVIVIPIAVIANGEGPTVLFCAGSHGNEYEGQVLLRELAGELSPEKSRAA